MKQQPSYEPTEEEIYRVAAELRANRRSNAEFYIGECKPKANSSVEHKAKVALKGKLANIRSDQERKK